MKNDKGIKKAVFSKSNMLLSACVYLAVSTCCSFLIFSGNNLAAPDLISKIVLMAVVLFIASPAFTFGALIMRLRLEHFGETKKLSDFLLPEKGTLGNPDLEGLFGESGKEKFKKFRVFFYIFIVVMFVTLILTSLLTNH